MRVLQKCHLLLRSQEFIVSALQTSLVLRERHRRVLETIARAYQETGYSPSVREIGDGAGISSTSVVHYYLDRLSLGGYLERRPGRNRTVKLTPKAHELLGGHPTERALQALREENSLLEQCVEELAATVRFLFLAVELGTPIQIVGSPALFFRTLR